MRSFREILDGKHDEVPERAFLLKGSIDEVVEGARDAGEQEQAEENRGEGEGEGEEGEGS